MKWHILETIILFSILVIMPATASAIDYDKPHIDATLLNQDPDPARPGQILEVRWKVVKEGNQPVDLIFRVDEAEYPLKELPDQQDRHLGPWLGWSDAKTQATLLYRFGVTDSAFSGVAEITLSYSVNGGADWIQLEPFEIQVDDTTDPSLVIGSIRTTPTSLVAGVSDGQLSVELVNIGDEDAQNVQARLLMPEQVTAAYSYADTATLGTIAAGESVSADFFVDIAEDVSWQSREMELELRYKEANDDTNRYVSKKMMFSLELDAIPSFEVDYVSYEPEAFAPGKTARAYINISNIGYAKGEAVSIRAFKESMHPFEFTQKSDFIGTLQPGEAGVAVLEMQIDDDAVPKEYRTDIEVRSIHEDDVVIETETIRIPIRAQTSGTTGISPGMMPGLAAVLVIGAAAGFFFGRRR
ncbi:MAG: COG1361 S-layer family protein [Nanoarchaeota archaeon]